MESISSPSSVTIVSLLVLWVTLWLQVFIVPFVNKPEKLFVTYKQSGDIDAAMSRIDSEEVVKELTSLFESAIELQEDKRRRADIERLLSQVEYANVLDRLEVATGKKAKITRSYLSLRSKSMRVWQYGLLHLLLLILGLAAGLWQAYGDSFRIVAAVVVTLSVLAAVVSATTLIGYSRDQLILLKLIEADNA